MVSEDNIELFCDILRQAAEWLESEGQLMWNPKDLTPVKLLEKYSIDEMRLCYVNESLIGAFIIQWYDPLFWTEIEKNTSGYIHKLAINNEYRGKGYGKQIIESAELMCKERNIEFLRLNCGTFRASLRKFYEDVGFQMVDRVFIDNRDQIRYVKKLV